MPLASNRAFLQWYAEPNAINNALDYAKFYSQSNGAVICVFDDAGNVTETHEDAGDFRVVFFTRMILGFPLKITSMIRLLSADCDGDSRIVRRICVPVWPNFIDSLRS